MKYRTKSKRNILVKIKFSAFEEKCVSPSSSIMEEKPLVVMQSCCSSARFAKNEKK